MRFVASSQSWEASALPLSYTRALRDLYSARAAARKPGHGAAPAPMSERQARRFRKARQRLRQLSKAALAGGLRMAFPLRQPVMIGKARIPEIRLPIIGEIVAVAHIFDAADRRALEIAENDRGHAVPAKPFLAFPAFALHLVAARHELVDVLDAERNVIEERLLTAMQE